MSTAIVLGMFGALVGGCLMFLAVRIDRIDGRLTRREDADAKSGPERYEAKVRRGSY